MKDKNFDTLIIEIGVTIRQISAFEEKKFFFYKLFHNTQIIKGCGIDIYENTTDKSIL